MEYINKKLEEFNNYLKGRKVAIIGLGVSNIPLIDYLYNLHSILFSKNSLNLCVLISFSF